MPLNCHCVGDLFMNQWWPLKMKVLTRILTILMSNTQHNIWPHYTDKICFTEGWHLGSSLSLETEASDKCMREGLVKLHCIMKIQNNTSASVPQHEDGWWNGTQNTLSLQHITRYKPEKISVNTPHFRYDCGGREKWRQPENSQPMHTDSCKFQTGFCKALTISGDCPN